MTDNVAESSPVSRAQPTLQGRSMLDVMIFGLKLLTPRERRQSYFLFGLMVATGLIDSLVVTSVIPLITIILDPDRIAKFRIIGPYAELLNTPQMLSAIMFGIAGLLTVSLALTLLTNWLIERHGALCKARLTEQLLEGVVSAPMAWLLRNNPTELARQIFHDLHLWRSEVVQAVLNIAQAVVISGFPLIAVVLLAPSAGLGVLLATALTALVTMLFARKRLVVSTTRAKHANVRAYRRLGEILSGVREVKMSGNASNINKKFLTDLSEQLDLAVSTRMWGTLPPMIVTFVGQIGFIIVAAVMWLTGSSGVEIAGVLGMLVLVVARVIPVVNRMLGQISNIYRVAPFLVGLFELMSEVKRAGRGLESAGGTVPVPDDWKSLELRNVVFNHPAAGRWSLDDVSLTITRGGYFGFAGRSGSGKSTIANLLVGLFEPERGAVTLDGRPLGQYRMNDWVRRIGMVPQDPFILDGSIADNIRFGAAAPRDDERLHKVMRQAHLENLENEIADVATRQVGERGKQISGGQAQRIAIARALYRECDLFVLDEATSSLDTITERGILQTLRSIEGRPTVIAIAHRLNLLKGCDQIFVLDNGKIVAQGKWDQLFRDSEEFRAMVEASEREAA